MTPSSLWLNTHQALLKQTPHISLHTCTFWHLTHTRTFHLHAARSLSIPSTHTTHYRSTKNASEKTAHKHISIQTESEFVFTVARQSALHICFSNAVKKKKKESDRQCRRRISSYGSGILHAVKIVMAQSLVQSSEYAQYGGNISHRYTGFGNRNAVRIHRGLYALVQRGRKSVGLIGSFAPIPLRTPVEERVTEI